jgi:hypothetical protein
MATLWIEEEPDVPKVMGGNVPTHDASLGGAVQQKVTIGGSSVQSNAFSQRTNFITIVADAACYIDIGSNPTATTSTRYLVSGVYRTFKVQSGHKIAVKDTT